MVGLYPRSLASLMLLSMKASRAGLAVRSIPIRAAYSNGLRDAIQRETDFKPRHDGATVMSQLADWNFCARQNADCCPHLRCGSRPRFAATVLPQKPGPDLTGPCRPLLRTVRNADPPQAARIALSVRAVARHRTRRR